SAPRRVGDSHHCGSENVEQNAKLCVTLRPNTSPSTPLYSPPTTPVKQTPSTPRSNNPPTRLQNAPGVPFLTVASLAAHAPPRPPRRITHARAPRDQPPPAATPRLQARSSP